MEGMHRARPSGGVQGCQALSRNATLPPSMHESAWKVAPSGVLIPPCVPARRWVPGLSSDSAVQGTGWGATIPTFTWEGKLSTLMGVPASPWLSDNHHRGLFSLALQAGQRSGGQPSS